MKTNSIQQPRNNKATKNIDLDIDSLNKYLSEVKKTRRHSEKVENQLSKRRLILNKEEKKAEKQLKLEEKNKEYKQQIKVNLLKNK